MIFVTVGSQGPFDRLTRTVDAWAERTGRDDIVAQVGPGAARLKHVQTVSTLSTESFRQLMFDAEAVVTHAGMGTILQALEIGRPLIIMPRRAALREQRNDHQMDTARALAQHGRIAVAWDEEELAGCLQHIDLLPTPVRIPSHASVDLLGALKCFIRGEDDVPAPALPTRAPTRRRVESDVPLRRAA